MSIEDDLTLAESIARGDEEAAAQFDALFRPWIEGSIRNRGVPANDRDDVVQEVLADAIRQLKAGRFRGAASLKTWLATMVGGKVMDYWRRHHRGPEIVPLADVDERERGLIVPSCSEEVARVREAFEKLSGKDRLILLLRERKGLKLAEIGRLLGLSTSAAHERLTKAQERFRAALETGNGPDSKRLRE